MKKDTIIKELIKFDKDKNGIYGIYLGVDGGFSMWTIPLERIEKCTVNYDEFEEEIKKLINVIS